MPMTIYKLYGAASTDSVASLDIQLDGVITSMLMTGMCAGVNALDEGMQAEISFLSSNTFGSNDVRGSLMTMQIRSGMLTSGMGNMCDNINISSVNIPVNAGERIHLHIRDAGTLTGRVVHAYLYVEDKGVSRLSSRRR